jgi:hypothetical protein
MQHNQQDESFGNWRVGMGIMLFVARSLALSLEVFIHGQFGHKYLSGVILLGAFVAPMLFASCSIHDPAGAVGLFYYWIAFNVMLFVRKLGVSQRRWKRQESFSEYNGWPELMRYFPTWDEMAVKKWLEPGICIAVGLLVTLVCNPLGMYIIACAVCMRICHGMAEWQEYERETQLRDAIAYQRYVAGRVRDRV